MMDFSHGTRTTLETYAHSMGVVMTPAGDGSCSFDFERGGRMTVISAENGEILVSLTRRIIVEGARNLALCAGLAGIDPYDGTSCHAGINKAGQPVLTLRLSEAGFDSARLDAAYMELGRRFEGVGF